MRKELRLFSIYFPICPVLYHQWPFKENLIQNIDVKSKGQNSWNQYPRYALYLWLFKIKMHLLHRKMKAVEIKRKQNLECISRNDFKKCTKITLITHSEKTEIFWFLCWLVHYIVILFWISRLCVWELFMTVSGAIRSGAEIHFRCPIRSNHFEASSFDSLK